jgi:cytochrome c oxidase subunit II
MRRALAFVASMLALSACSGIQSALDPAADQASAIGDMWHLMLAVCGFMYALVLAFLAVALVRAWRRETASSLAGEVALTRMLYGFIALVVVGLVTLAVGSFLVDRRLFESGPEPLHVRITGMQWWWQVEYPSGDPAETVITANELHLPVGRETEIQLRTNDVIHSLWIPNLNGKLDLIPGRINTLRITPRRTGTFRGQCAEFCGLDHAWMALDVRVDDKDAFEAWRRHQLEPARAPQAEGERAGADLFMKKPCTFCHAITGSDASARAGPDLTHFGSRTTLAAGARPLTRETLDAWLADPQRIKPGAHMPRIPLTDDERARLVDYLLSLK